MIKDLFAGTALQRLERTLDLTAFRHKLISSNIANEETPDYKARDIDFKKELEGAMGQGPVRMAATDPGHFPSGGVAGQEPFIVESEETRQGLDKNTVSLEKEMVKMAENTLLYNASVSIISRKFNGLMAAIREGR